MKKKKKKEKRSRPEEEQNFTLLQESPPQEQEPEGDGLLRLVVSLVGGKWKIRILWALRSGQPARYGELRQRISGITDMMLSQSLRELAADGLVERRQYQEIPPRVEYAATEDGVGLLPSMELLCAWAGKQKKAD